MERDDEGALQARTLLGVLQERHPGRLPDGQVRTLQRRLRDWRALHGPEKEVLFEQVHVPGREALDFTHATKLGVTVQGTLLVHLLFEFVLSFQQLDVGRTWRSPRRSRPWSPVCRARSGTWMCDRGRTVRQLVGGDTRPEAEGGGELTNRFQAILDHYGLRPTRIRPGESHENGVVEQRHFRTKQAIAEALVVRG